MEELNKKNPGEKTKEEISNTDNFSIVEIKKGTKKVVVKNQYSDISNGLEKTPVYFLLKYSTKLLRSKFDYKSNYIVKSCIRNGNIDEYLLTKDYSCLCEDYCEKENCDCVLNHVQRYECNDNCKCDKDACENRVVQRGITCRLRVNFISKEKGFGVFALGKIKKDDFICEYLGQIINKDFAKEKINCNLMKKKPNYVLQIRENYEKMTINTFIDSEEFGNVSRFLNHSCDPNLYFDIVRINHFIPQVAFFALREIEVGEELTFSYCEYNDSKEENYKESQKKCLCGSEKCMKFLPS